MHSIPQLKKLVDEALNGLSLNREPAELYDPIRYMLSLEAKRMRPVLVLCGCELFDGDIMKALHPAMGIEVFHNFTLMHDDIMDKAPLRRSKPTVHEKWNSDIAILSGDTMFVKACQLMLEVEPGLIKQVMELFYQTAIQVCEGQQTDMGYEAKNDISIEDYISMIRNKTAVLLAASLRIGAMIAHANNDDADHLYNFGADMGIAFQLKDDLLDAFGDEVKFGKQKGGDIRSDKKTFLYLKAKELAKDKDEKQLWHLMTNFKNEPELKVNGILAIYEKLGVRDYAEAEMEKYFQEAIYHLDSINVPDSRKEVLRGFAEKLMVREV